MIFYKKVFIFYCLPFFIWGCSQNLEVDYKFYKEPKESKILFPLSSSSFLSYKGYTIISYGFINSHITRIKNNENHNQALGHGLICLDSEMNILWEKNTLFSNDETFLNPLFLKNDKIYAAKIDPKLYVSKELVSIDLNSGDVNPFSIEEENYYFQGFDLKSFMNPHNYLIVYEDSLIVSTSVTSSYEKTNVKVYNNGQMEWSDNFELQYGASYFNPDIPAPIIFIISSGNLICLDLLTGKKVWSLKSLNKGLATIMNYDSETGLLYFKHGYIYAIDYKTGEIKYEIDKVYLDKVNGVASHKIFNNNYLFGRDSKVIDVYDKYSGKLVHEIHGPNEDIYYDMTFDDLMIKDENLVIITSNPLSIVEIPINQALIINEMDIQSDSIIVK